ncbi:NIPSNAP family protein [Thalassobaculum sp.]|uniref:NIPSNAP family protein n=1 Tax=Thalassobaculum sp. TaxID=2022740 RepID=UPI0032EB69F7
MIYEFRTYTTPIGMAPELARLSGEIGRDIRKDDYGKLEGYWLTEIGPLNQVMHLWSYADLNTRQELRTALGQNEAWRSKYLTVAGPLIRRQDVRLMWAMKPVVPPTGTGHVYEYRFYRCKVGKSRPFAEKLRDVLPAREKYSKNVAIWLTEAGQPNEVSHLWAYDSLNHRAEVRAAAMRDPDWREFLKNGPEMLEEMHSSILMPSAHSPMK